MPNRIMKYLRLITLLSALVLCSSIVFAQSSGDKLYNQGLQLQKTMTVTAQNQAIAKFKSAKKLYDSAVKKSQCDQAIIVSQGIIQHLQKPQGNSTTPSPSRKSHTAPTLDISPAWFNLSQESQTVQVLVASNQEDWSVFPVNEGTDHFAYATRNGNYIDIYVPANNSYQQRSQKFLVTVGDIFKEIQINQTGQQSQSSSGGDGDMSASLRNFRSQIVEYLRYEGHNPSIDSDGDVKFTYNGSTFFIQLSNFDDQILVRYLVFVTVPERVSNAQATNVAYNIVANKICCRAYLISSGGNITVRVDGLCTGIQMFKDLFRANMKLIDSVSDQVISELKNL